MGLEIRQAATGSIRRDDTYLRLAGRRVEQRRFETRRRKPVTLKQRLPLRVTVFGISQAPSVTKVNSAIRLLHKGLPDYHEAFAIKVQDMPDDSGPGVDRCICVADSWPPVQSASYTP